jgi:hypothetical protein
MPCCLVTEVSGSDTWALGCLTSSCHWVPSARRRPAAYWWLGSPGTAGRLSHCRLSLLDQAGFHLHRLWLKPAKDGKTRTTWAWRSSFFFFFFLSSTGVWTQDLHLEPLHQPFYCDFFFFWDRISQTICPGWLWTTVLLISASWIATITGVSQGHPAKFSTYEVKWRTL